MSSQVKENNKMETEVLVEPKDSKKSKSKDSNKTESKEQKKKSKFLKWTSIIMIIIFGISMGIGAIIGVTTKKPFDYVIFYVNGKKYDEAPETLISTYEGETTDGGTTDGGTTDGGETTISETEQEANKIIALYLSTALFGDASAEDVNDEYNYVFSEGNDWNTPYLLLKDEDANEEKDISPIMLKDTFVAVKFFSSTLNSSVYSYLLELSTNSLEMQKIINRIENAYPDSYESLTFIDFKNGNGFTATGEDADAESLFNDTIDVLESHPDYKKDILMEMYVYAYLWQDSSMHLYDYNFTRELVYAKPSMVASAEFDVEKTESNPGSSWNTTYDELKTHSIGDQVDATTWNGYYDQMYTEGVLTNNSTSDNQLDSTTFKGFDGIKFGTSAGEKVRNDWLDIEDTWQTENPLNEDTINAEAITQTNIYSHTNVLTNGNYYISNETQGGAEGEGAIISNLEDSADPSDFTDDYGIANIYVYTQLYPYTFAEYVGTDLNTEYRANEYSLFANRGEIDPATESYKYSKATLDDKVNGNVADGYDDVSYIFDEWFGDYANVGEIYVAHELIQFNSKLEQKAMEYWNDKGFYIELSGEYSDKYEQYIPDALLKGF